MQFNLCEHLFSSMTTLLMKCGRAHGSAENAIFYGRNEVPFVMGTTGGDRQQLMADVTSAGVHAVIAPQMGKQVGATPLLKQTAAQNAAAQVIRCLSLLQSNSVSTRCA